MATWSTHNHTPQLHILFGPPKSHTTTAHSIRTSKITHHNSTFYSDLQWCKSHTTTAHSIRTSNDANHTPQQHILFGPPAMQITPHNSTFYSDLQRCKSHTTTAHSIRTSNNANQMLVEWTLKFGFNKEQIITVELVTVELLQHLNVYEWESTHIKTVSVYLLPKILKLGLPIYYLCLQVIKSSLS